MKIDKSKKQEINPNNIVHFNMFQDDYTNKKNMYEKYIELGFERIDINDKVEFNETGYYGFILSYKLNKTSNIQVCYGDLDNPILHIRKPKSITNYMLKLTYEHVVELIK